MKEDNPIVIGENQIKAKPHKGSLCVDALTQIKVRINALLWEFLPGGVTLEEADDLSLEMFHLIEDEFGD